MIKTRMRVGALQSVTGQRAGPSERAARLVDSMPCASCRDCLVSAGMFACLRWGACMQGLWLGLVHPWLSRLAWWPEHAGPFLQWLQADKEGMLTQGMRPHARLASMYME